MTTNKLGHGSPSNAQHAGIASQIKALQSKKFPATWDNSHYCDVIQYLDNQYIGDCELAAVLHMLKIQYAMVGKSFEIADDQGSFLFLSWGSTSDQKAENLVRNIENKYEPSNLNNVLNGSGGITESYLDKYAHLYGLIGAHYSKVHALKESELLNVNLMKQLVYYYGAVPVSIEFTNYEYSYPQGGTVNAPVYTFDIPPKCPWSGIELVKILTSFLPNLLDNDLGVASTISEMWKMHPFTDVNPLNLSQAFYIGDITSYTENERNQPYVPWSASDHPAFFKKLAQFSAWGDKSGARIGGHEIIITGWDVTGFKIVTWAGTGHMSYDYWYLHHTGGRVIIPDVWDGYIQGKNATLLLGTL